MVLKEWMSQLDPLAWGVMELWFVVRAVVSDPQIITWTTLNIGNYPPKVGALILYFFLVQLPPHPQRNFMNESLVGSGVESWLSRGILLTTAWQATEQGKPKRSLTSHVHHHLARQLQNTDIKNPHHMMGAHQIGYCLVSTPSLVTSNASLSCYTLFSGSSFF